MDAPDRILAIETSGRHGSVAALVGSADGARLLKQHCLSGEERTAQILAPSIQKLLEDLAWPSGSIRLVAATVGPGSFTGLRIGVTTAKAFAYAIQSDLIGVHVLETIAIQAPPSEAPLWAVMDAQRQELFAARFTRDRSGLVTEHETSIVSQVGWLNSLKPHDRVTGPALRRLISRLPDEIDVVPEEFWQPTAETVGQLAWKNYLAGQRDDIWQFVPQYYRTSAAEEKLQS
jgi:tRNA threonylcarbamoyladenosine biosynthesis protein TsaB